MAGFLRPSDLERVDLDATMVSSDKVLFLNIIAPKEKRHGQRVTKVITIHPHTDPFLCPVAVFEEYKQRIASSDCRTAHPLFLTIKLNRLLRSLQNHNTPIAVKRISKYIKQIMTKVGRPAQAPVPKARGLAATLAVQAGVSVDNIIAHGSWSSRDIFEHYYRLSSATSTNFSVSTLDQQPRSRLTKCNVM
ncbi:uncharacterized protein RHIMIDRAFT_242178 [Rhizopus microsporus ATCC 52813]|uniref:Tyr recombinase domain-containing protein n=1 Tax=Rhizopus microsporus ATCC 52813 TaxID=1340429 RepID=A0A2G4SGC6_RHIZD|nr:uncharacterized protein RHIMIDRAFT_242178 [Rhizopus microsporus ATCC 52813]PHZ07828.1 hypothetical protein RHIMIDRAFT_242178 [Rhizopus microsporus ATCC 52813]